MEAIVGSITGLLPQDVAVVRLQALEDGSWQASCESDEGHARSLHFEPSGEAEIRIAEAFQTDLGFTHYAARETARRLFEPFLLAADWR
jgi:hypothetical protein